MFLKFNLLLAWATIKSQLHETLFTHLYKLEKPWFWLFHGGGLSFV
ncbi:hypothetical protein [Nostoc sp. TCL240-02]|nr:hypothetical protein [Nostoc sp. TCL240-02]